jgi:hypothetical protein
MRPEVIPIGCALLASITALAIALQNRRWIKADRQADRLAAAADRQLAAQAATTRRAAEELFGYLPSGCPALIERTGGPSGFVDAVRTGMAAIEPVRRWAATLPLPWRLRVDAQLSLLAHFGWREVAAQLEHDVIALLNGQDLPSAMDDELVVRFGIYLLALLSTDRYQNDPATRTLAAALQTEILPPGTERRGIDDGVSARARELLSAVTGRPELLAGQGVLALRVSNA